MAKKPIVEPVTWAQCEDRNNQWTISERKQKYYVMAHPMQKKRFLTKAELDAVDPRLALFLEVHAGPRPSGAGENVYFTMRLWQREKSLAVGGNSFVSDHFVDRIHKVIGVDELQGSVVIEGDIVKIAGHPGMQCVPSYGLHQLVSISFDSFESFLPGSIGRLHTGLAVGFSAEDLAKHMLTEPTPISPAAKLPGDITPGHTYDGVR